jgi:hypothetical protein
LLDFSATIKDADVVVTWMVAGEKDMATYIVERSTDGVVYKETGRVEAAGKTSYDLLDMGAIEAATGVKLFYRLRMINTSGTMAYSKIVIVQPKTSDYSFAIYPNPFSENITVTTSADEAGSYTILIKDISGKTVAEQSARIATGVQHIRVENLGRLPKGIYKLMTEINGTVQTATIVK